MEGLKEGARLAPGSLPQEKPSEGVRTQIAAYPEIPAWPQLPRGSPTDRAGLQELSGMPVLTWSQIDQPVLHIDHPGFGEVAELLRSENREGPYDRGALKHEDAPGFYAFMREAGNQFGAETQAVKGQCTGPATLGLLVKDGHGKPVLASKEGMEALREYILLHAKWQCGKLSVFEKPVVFVFDEPALGSTFKPEDYGLSWKDVITWFERLIVPLQEEGVIVGLHCCGPGPWDWAFRTPAELFHFDADRYRDSLAEKPEELKRFLHEGGSLVWGIVPTSRPPKGYPHPVDLLNVWTALTDRLISAGVKREDLYGRSLFSTACGMGATSLQEAAEAFRCLWNFTGLWKSAKNVP